jgi:hypothetical protein
MIHFSCPGCSKEYRVAEEFAGRATKCHACGQPFRVPVIAAKGTAPRLRSPASQPIVITQTPNLPVPRAQYLVQPETVSQVVPVQEERIECPLCSQSMLLVGPDMAVWLECLKCHADFLVLACERGWRAFARNPNHYLVKVSARLLQWPAYCVCCLRTTNRMTVPGTDSI